MMSPLAGLLDKTHKYGSANSYDAVKCIALITMVIDHLGEYLFPEAMWLRVAGRAAMPLFFFLIGYNGSYGVSRQLLLAALVVLLLNFLFRYPIFPLDILFSIIITRLALGVLHKRAMLFSQLGGVLLAGLVFLPLTIVLVDYGTFGLLIAVGGYLVRFHSQWQWTAAMLGGILSAHMTVQWGLMDVDKMYVSVLAAITIALFFGLRHFTLHDLTGRLPQAMRLPVQFISRNMLWLYVVHLAVLMTLGSWLVEPVTARPPVTWIEMGSR